MFRKNKNHLQAQMFSSLDELHKTARKRLENSWAPIFYKEYFCRIDESIFSVLYSASYSRPNVPVNILVGFETLKSGFGWSDEELYDHYLFDLMVRRSLGLKNISENYFDLRTIYYFRSALIQYEEETGINLINEATKKITGEQIEKFKVKTGIQRMDSTLIQSNIRRMSRIQLLVELIQRLYCIISEAEKREYAEQFSEYVGETALQYCYRIKRDEAKTRLERIGQIICIFVEKFDHYEERKEYENLKRAFSEHFEIKENKVEPIEAKNLTGKTLQSPDDTTATFRSKRKEQAQGYVGNITETCDSENELQLITKASIESNVTDDQNLLENDIEEIKKETGLDELWTDGGYVGDTAAEATKKNDVDHRVTAVKGRKKEAGALGLEDFAIEKNEDGIPVKITCPNGATGDVKNARKEDRYSAVFDSEKCEVCPLKEQCPAKTLKKKPLFIVRFSLKNIRVAEQKKRVQNQGQEGNIRAAVESTIRSVIHPFGGHLCKMPVRGIYRIRSMIILSAVMVNIRRITAYVTGTIGSSVVSTLNATIFYYLNRFFKLFENLFAFFPIAYKKQDFCR
jgi:hypothetical protein